MVITGLHLEQFRCGDNLAYMLYGKKGAVAIDGVAWEEMLRFLDKQGLSLTYVTNTHGHFDHTVGNEPLLRHSRALYLDHNEFPDGVAIEIEGEAIRVYRTPGHTADSVCFHAGGILITGDTLFNGTVGNCFSGDLRAFFRSIKRLMALPGDTLIYAGHDYGRDSVALAKQLEPDNPDIDQFRQAYDPGHVYSTLAEELKINPYLRFNAPAIIALLKEHDLPCATEEERWLSLMSIE
ncbi:MAG: MBL fold metallo-hydrolase [Deltaproteobacteria bacterium]|nr:MBL fold metallo-hydrolase [Deltaproteobacteria bacterium]